MSPEDKIKELANGIGALIDISYMFYTISINKFSKEQAFELTKAFMQTSLMISATRGGTSE